MRISVETKSPDGTKYSYVLFEQANAIYLETENGLEMRQDADLPGYRITEVGGGADGEER